jgi:hypothetical protein
MSSPRRARRPVEGHGGCWQPFLLWHLDEQPLEHRLVAVAADENPDSAGTEISVYQAGDFNLVHDEGEPLTDRPDGQAIRSPAGPDRVGGGSREQVDPAILVAAPGVDLAAVARFKHVVASGLIDAVARLRCLVADDDSVAAAGRTSDLPEPCAQHDVGGCRSSAPERRRSGLGPGQTGGSLRRPAVPPRSGRSASPTAPPRTAHREECLLARVLAAPGMDRLRWLPAQSGMSPRRLRLPA